jgi:short-subunit dehydrogenase
MKATLITGASSGIGEAFARRLARDGHDLVLVARGEEKLHELCDELMLKHKITAHYIAIDLLKEAAVETVFNDTLKHGFEVDCLINNAGFGSMGDFAELDRENELDIIRLNILALVSLTHCYLAAMRERKSGTIINVSSTAGFQPIPFFATYAATKAFVTSFTESIAEENRPFGIRILALCPGTTKTNFFAASKIDDPLLLKRLQTPEQVVETALKAVKAGKSKVVSGWANYFVAMAGAHTPTALTVRVLAKALKSRYQK